MNEVNEMRNCRSSSDHKDEEADNANEDDADAKVHFFQTIFKKILSLVSLALGSFCGLCSVMVRALACDLRGRRFNYTTDKVNYV